MIPKEKENHQTVHAKVGETRTRLTCSRCSAEQAGEWGQSDKAKEKEGDNDSSSS